MIFRYHIILLLFLCNTSFAEPSNNKLGNSLSKDISHFNSTEFNKSMNMVNDFLNQRIHEGRKFIAEAKYVDAVETFTELLELAKAHNDSTYIVTAYGYLCLTHGIVGNPTETLYYAELSNSYLGSNTNETIKRWTQVGLGSAHFLNNNYLVADSILSEVIRKCHGICYDDQYLIYAFKNLAQIKFDSRNLTEAKDLLIKAIGYPNTHHKGALISSYYLLGRVYNKLGDTKTAHHYFNLSHDLAVLEPDKSFLARIYTKKARFFNDNGDYKRSAYFYSLADSLYENVINSRISQEVQRVTLNYQREYEIKQIELRKQELEIEKLKIARKSARQSVFLSILLFTLSLIISLLMFNKKRRAQKVATLEQEISKQKELQLQNFIRGQEDERNRLARDLHDGIGSQMAILKMHLSKSQLSKFDDYDKANIPVKLCDDIYQSLRDVAFNLLPRPLVREGLVSALEELTRKLNKSSDVEFSFNNYGLYNRLSNDKEAGLFRIAQEITANIIKHSSATSARIDVTCDQKSLVLTISWDGKGFNPELLEKSTGYGWKNINTRLNQLNGNILIDSSEESDYTTAIVDIPNNNLKQYGKTG